MLSALAAGMGRTARVALRVNPDVDAGTHAKITTGRARGQVRHPLCRCVPPLPPRRGAAGHPAGRTRDAYRQPDPVAGTVSRRIRAAGRTGADAARGRPAGQRGRLRRRPRHPLSRRTGAAARRAGRRDPRRAAQPRCAHRGWSRAAGWSDRRACCWRRVVLAKQTQGSRFVVLDAAMNDLVRPAMYDAWHGIVPVSAVDAVAPVTPADVVGPVCESGDTFARDRTAAAAGGRRARGDPRCRRLWFGDEFGLQCAARGGRGDGGRRATGR